MNNPISFVPPKAVQKVATRALRWRREYGRGGTMIGVARARDLSNGRPVSLKTVKRMKAYFTRHAVDAKATGFYEGEPGFPTAGRIAWDLWGGTLGFEWALGILERAK